MNNELLGKREKNTRERRTLTSFQVNRIFGFFSDKNTMSFSLFDGFLSQEEKDILRENIKQRLERRAELSLPQKDNSNIIPFLAELMKLPDNLRKKIEDYCELYVISASDVLNIENDDIEKLPLPVFLSLNTLGKKTLRQAMQFLENGGIITVFFYKRPLDFYIKAIDELPENMSLREKISLVLSGKSNRSIEEASHQFISVDFIPPEQTKPQDLPGNYNHLRKIINRRLDKKVERFYAEIVLMEELLRGHMSEVKISLSAMSVMAGFFYLLDQFVKGNINSDFYSAFQALVKITTHLTANLIDFYSQYKLLIKGEDFIDQIKDLIKRFDWREAFIFANGGFMDLLSELVGEINNILGSVFFGLEPVVGTGLTTLAASSRMSGKNFREKIRQIIENPAILGMNTAAFLTFLTSVGLLGLADQFHNPLAVVLAGGVSEPIYALLFTELFSRLKIKKMRDDLKNN